jgi:uncharacterized repeat protein (TIGR01451 family)
MRKILLVSFYLSASTAFSQVSVTLLSKSSNVFTVAGVRTQLWADPQTNEIIFVHRSDSTGNALEFDKSTDGGTNWTLDQGPLYSSESQHPRYPLGLLFNPSGVPDPDSNYVSFLAPLNDGSTWTGIVQGQQQASSGSTSTLMIDSTNSINHLLPSGYTITQQGVIWSVDAQYLNDTIYNNILIVTKGTWNSNSWQYDFTTQFLNAPVITSSGIARYLGCNIAFAPNGLDGYVVMIGNDGSISDSVYYPLVFVTSDGGQSWSGPTNIGLNVDPLLGLSSPFYTMGPQFDVAVDATGSLHILCEILEGDNAWGGNGTSGNFGIFDISTLNTNQWKAELVSKPMTYMGTFGVGTGSDPLIYEYNRPQISMDVTGNKMFFTWIDTDTLTFFIFENIVPDIHARGFDVQTQLWTSEVNFTVSTNADGSCTFNNVSRYCFSGGGDYTIPFTYTVPFGTQSTGSPVDHFYISGASINDAQFTLTGSPINIPGDVSGSHHSISGLVFLDSNGNGIFDGTEIVIPNQKIEIQPENITLFTDVNGNYFFYNWFHGTYHTISLIPPAGWMISSDSLSFTVPDDTVNQSGFDFGMNGITPQNHLDVSIASGVARCGFTVSYWINYENSGTTVLDGQIIYVVDNAVTFVSSIPSPDVNNGDTLIFYFTNLNPFTSGQIHLNLQLPLQQGDTIHFAAIAQNDSLGTYNTLGENNLVQIVSCSFDPNDKTVNPSGINTDHFTYYLDSLFYTIRFQNTGNDTAFTVELRDTLDESLDLNTFHITGSSHEVNASIYPGRIAVFRFENILLPDSSTDLAGSNGFVQYRIQALSNLSLPVEIKNTAYIYFDYNQPVTTNTVSNTLVVDPYVGIPHEDYGFENVTVVPNPFTYEADLVVSGDFQKNEFRLRIMNAFGMLVVDKMFTGPSEKIYRGKLSPGIYFYQLQGENGKCNSGKLIIQ